MSADHGSERADGQQRRAERLDADPAATPPHRRRTVLTGVVVGIVLLLAVGLVAVTVGGPSDDGGDGDGGDAPAAGVPEGTEEVAVGPATHVTEEVAYDRFPPAGGSHDPAWLNCGVYTEAVRPENAVHSMEHGAVWVTYDPIAVEAEAIQYLGGRPHVLVSPTTDISAPVVATAWGRQLELDGPDDPRLEQFLRAFVQGPQTPEPGAPCTGGIGQPNG
jgi:hypothetical protein